MVEMEMHHRLIAIPGRAHSIGETPDQKSSEPAVAILRFDDLFSRRRLIWKFQSRTVIGHDCVDDKLVVTDGERCEALGLAKSDDRLGCLLHSELKPTNDVSACAPDACIAFDEPGNLRHIEGAGIDRRFYLSPNADAEHKIERECNDDSHHERGAY